MNNTVAIPIDNGCVDLSSFSEPMSSKYMSLVPPLCSSQNEMEQN